MKLKIKPLYICIALLWSIIYSGQAQFTNDTRFNSNFSNDDDKNLPTLVDFDLDGNLDLMSSYEGNQKIWRWTGISNSRPTWEQMSININGRSSTIPKGAIVWADINNDGILDIIATPVYSSKIKILIQQINDDDDDDTLYFTDDPNIMNNLLPTSGCLSNKFYDETRVAVGDFDKNGKLDLLITFYGGKDNNNGCAEKKMPPILLLQTSTLVFDKIEISEEFISMGSKLCDYDNDGDLDAYIGSYRGLNNILLKWNNRSFVEVGTTENQIALRKGNSDRRSGHCVGVEWLDYDNDGDFDLFISNLKHGGTHSGRVYGVSELFKNVNGILTSVNQNDIGLETHVEATTHHVQQSVSFDYDNDGDVDIFQPRNSQGDCDVDQGEGSISQLYVNDLNSEGRFNQESILSNLNDNFSVIAGDCDNDGDMDIITSANYGNWGDRFTCNAPAISDIKYLENNTDSDSDFNNNDFLKIRLEGDTDGNRLTAGVGAEIYIDDNKGGIMSRLVEISTSGQKVGSSYIKHFGLGQWNFQKLYVYVKWPNEHAPGEPVVELERFQIDYSQLNDGTLNNGTPITLVKNSNTSRDVPRVFYCEDGVDLYSATDEDYNAGNALHTFLLDLKPSERFVKWQIQMKPHHRNPNTYKYWGNWQNLGFTSHPLSIQVNKKYDIIMRALIQGPNGQCYSKVASGNGSVNYRGARLQEISPDMIKEVGIINVSPNPATDLININIDKVEDAQKIELFNSNGVNVYSSDITDNTKQTYQISLKDLPSGIYFVNVHQSNGIKSVKVIKQ